MEQQVVLTLRYLRSSAGLTQKEVAERLGVNRITILRWERGEAAPSSIHINRLSDILGVHPKVVLDALSVAA